MRTFAQRQNPAQQPGVFNFARSSAAEPAAFPKDAEFVEDSAPAAVMDFAHDFSRIPVSAMPLALLVQNRPMMLMRQPDDKAQPQKQPAPAQPQKQPVPAQQGLCSKVNLSALKLPRKNNGGTEFSEATINGIRFLVALSAAQASAVQGNFKKMAAHIDRLNLFITNPTNQVKLVIVTNGASMFRSLCGQPVLIVDPKEFDAQTVVHETTHGVTAEFAQRGQAGGAQDMGAKNFLDKAADIFLQLSSLNIEVSAGNKITATYLVDPPTLNPKATGEHPGDNVDEFISSAVAAYLLNKNVLEKKIQEFGKKDPKVKQAGEELLLLLSAVLDKNTLPTKTPQLTSATKDVDEEVKKIKSTPAVDDATLATHGLLTELLLPQNPAQPPANKPNPPPGAPPVLPLP